jgi:nicotinamide riboside kinase
MKRIKKNNLLPWFTDDHRTLPASYKRSCEKFFKSLKQQAKSRKLQASSLTKKG